MPLTWRTEPARDSSTTRERDVEVGRELAAEVEERRGDGHVVSEALDAQVGERQPDPPGRLGVDGQAADGRMTPVVRLRAVTAISATPQGMSRAPTSRHRGHFPD